MQNHRMEKIKNRNVRRLLDEMPHFKNLLQSENTNINAINLIENRFKKHSGDYESFKAEWINNNNEIFVYAMLLNGDIMPLSETEKEIRLNLISEYVKFALNGDLTEEKINTLLKASNEIGLCRGSNIRTFLLTDDEKKELISKLLSPKEEEKINIEAPPKDINLNQIVGKEQKNIEDQQKLEAEIKKKIDTVLNNADTVDFNIDTLDTLIDEMEAATEREFDCRTRNNIE